MSQINTFCWNELNAKDAAACKKFCGAVFGWTAEDMPFGPMTYTIFKKDGQQVAGMMQMTAEWGNVKPHWMPYIAVDDCDAAARRITGGENIGGTGWPMGVPGRLAGFGTVDYRQHAVRIGHRIRHCLIDQHVA